MNIEDELVKLLPGPYYMDPPDGGDVSLLEQLRRMSEDAKRYRFLRKNNNGRFIVISEVFGEGTYDEVDLDYAIDQFTKD